MRATLKAILLVPICLLAIPVAYFGALLVYFPTRSLLSELFEELQIFTSLIASILALLVTLSIAWIILNASGFRVRDVKGYVKEIRNAFRPEE